MLPVDPQSHRADLIPIRVVVADDHPALRAGLVGLLRGEDRFTPVGTVTGPERLAPALAELRPDVVVLDYAFGRGNGLRECFRIKQRPAPPRVVLYCSHVDPVFAVPARLAQADAMVSKAAPVVDLLATIEAVAAGRPVLPVPGPDALEAAFARLDQRDLPVAGMLMAQTSAAEIAATLGEPADAVVAQALRLIGTLQAAEAPPLPVAAVA